MERQREAMEREQTQWRAAQEALWAWRQQHPTATFNALEEAVEQQVDRLRAQLLTDLALASRAADLRDKQAGAPPRCPTCGERLIRQGRHRRRVQITGNQPVDLERDYAVCPACETGLFPPG